MQYSVLEILVLSIFDVFTLGASAALSALVPACAGCGTLLHWAQIAKTVEKKGNTKEFGRYSIFVPSID